MSDTGNAKALKHDAMVGYSELVRRLEGDIKKLKQENASLQAKIDALMLEYCPDEMSQEQIETWCKAQRKVEV